jgi:hypothetical protein
MSENLSRQELRRQKELKEINQTEEKNNIISMILNKKFQSSC